MTIVPCNVYLFCLYCGLITIREKIAHMTRACNTNFACATLFFFVSYGATRQVQAMAIIYFRLLSVPANILSMFSMFVLEVSFSLYYIFYLV